MSKLIFFFSSRRRHTRLTCDWSSDVCSSDLRRDELRLDTPELREVHASSVDLSKFRRIEPQFIAALGDPEATSGNGAQSWGFWNQDPGPRACKLDHYPQLKQNSGLAPAQWKFDAKDWWLEEHGFIMEKPTFPLPPGQYLVTGDRQVTTVLTIHTKDKDGNERWELADGATLYDVTHLGCRSARYTPATAKDNSCSPESVQSKGFP